MNDVIVSVFCLSASGLFVMLGWLCWTVVQDILHPGDGS